MQFFMADYNSGGQYLVTESDIWNVKYSLSISLLMVQYKQFLKFNSKEIRKRRNL